MSNKAQERVGYLLKKNLTYVYKPVDGRHGGAVKLDFLGCSPGGVFWAVEVKATNNQNFYNPNVTGASGVSALQRIALDQIAKAVGSVVIVAVVAGDKIYFFDWRDVRDEEIWAWSHATIQDTFRTWALWGKIDLLRAFYDG